MVRTALDVKPELILAVVREAIDYLPTLQQPAILTLHPDDALIVKGSIGHELDKSGWRVVEDANIARGGCRVDSDIGLVDATIEERWRRAVAALGSEVPWHDDAQSARVVASEAKERGDG
jgi:flagellar assembly protein FliH